MLLQNRTQTYTCFSYWIGSQQTQAPIYQYRLILPFDDKCKVASEIDGRVQKFGFVRELAWIGGEEYGIGNKTESVLEFVEEFVAFTMFLELILIVPL